MSEKSSEAINNDVVLAYWQNVNESLGKENQEQISDNNEIKAKIDYYNNELEKLNSRLEKAKKTRNSILKKLQKVSKEKKNLRR